MRRIPQVGVWLVCVGLGFAWMGIQWQRSQLADEIQHLLDRKVTPLPPSPPPTSKEPSAMSEHPDLESLRFRARELYRLRNQATQLRQHQQALSQAWKKTRASQAGSDPILEENRRIQIEISRLETIQRNLQTPSDRE